MQDKLLWVICLIGWLLGFALMFRKARRPMPRWLRWVLFPLPYIILGFPFASAISFCRLFGMTSSLLWYGSLAAASLVGGIVIHVASRHENGFLQKRPAYQLILAILVIMGLGGWIQFKQANAQDAAFLADADAALEHASVPAAVPSEDAGPLYDQLAVLGKTPEANTLFDQLEIGADSESFAAILKPNEPMLVLARQAAQKPGLNPFATEDPPLDDLQMSRHSSLRGAAILLSAAARSEARQGNIDQALTDLRLCQTTVKHSESSQGIVGFYVSISLDHLANKTCVQILPAVRSASQADQIQQSLQEDLVPLLHRQMQYELGMQIYRVLDLQGGRSRPFYLRVGPGNLWHQLTQQWITQFKWGNQQLLSIIQHPFYESTKERQDFRQAIDQIRPSLATILFPTYNSLFEKLAEAQASRRAVEVAIAQTHYRLDHGGYTDDLAKLVPTYLPAMPIDPFDGKPMRVKSQPDGGLLIYSVGQDLKDDGGNIDKNPTDATKPTDVGFLLKPARH